MVKIFPNGEELIHFAAEKFVKLSIEAIADRGKFTVALSGGSTPKAFYQLLASEQFRGEIDWKHCFFFFGDERNVPPDDAESNYRMAKENLFDLLNINEFAIQRWNTEDNNIEKIAEDYDTAIYISFALDEVERFPRFDLILLGMGDDGHTASLFPYTEALNETEKIAVSNKVEKLDTTRLTLTFRAINNARNIIFLVKGEDKAETLREVLRGEFQPEKFPAQNVKPENGELFWLVDEAAARFL